MITQTARKMTSFALTVTMLVLTVGCSTQTVQRDDRAHRQPMQNTPQRVMTLGEEAAAVAMRQVGVPYLYGGANTRGFDCSGLVHYSYGRAGKAVPRTTGQLWSATSAVQRRDLRVGDLLFFKIEGKMAHVGLYLGGQRFVHAPSSGRTVTVATLDSPFYAAALSRGGRPR